MECGLPCWRPTSTSCPQTTNSRDNYYPLTCGQRVMCFTAILTSSRTLSWSRQPAPFWNLIWSKSQVESERWLRLVHTSARLWITVCLFARGDFTPWFSEELYFPRPSFPCSVVGQRPYFTAAPVAYSVNWKCAFQCDGCNSKVCYFLMAHVRLIL